jgi:hypothetical protein
LKQIHKRTDAGTSRPSDRPEEDAIRQAIDSAPDIRALREYIGAHLGKFLTTGAVREIRSRVAKARRMADPRDVDRLTLGEVVAIRDGGEAGPAEPATEDRPITLAHAAALANVSEKTLRRRIKNGTFPDPVKDGGGGKHALFPWAPTRDFIREEFGKDLPDRRPTDL